MVVKADDRLADYLCTFKADSGETCEDCKRGIPEGGNVYFWPDGGMSPDGTYRCQHCSTGIVDGKRWQDELRDALRVLADSHTRDDYAAGFVVEGSRDPLRDSSEYLHAWTIVRQAIGYQVDPVLRKFT